MKINAIMILGSNKPTSGTMTKKEQIWKGQLKDRVPKSILLI